MLSMVSKWSHKAGHATHKLLSILEKIHYKYLVKRNGTYCKYFWIKPNQIFKISPSLKEIFKGYLLVGNLLIGKRP